MVAKDLVHESSAYVIGQPDVQGKAESRQKELDDPPPRLARFIKKSEQTENRNRNISRPSSDPPSSTTLTPSSRSLDTKYSADSSTKLLHKSLLHTPTPLHLKQRQNENDPESIKSLFQHSYPPSTSDSSRSGIALKSPVSYSHYPRHHSNHNPIAATVLFDRNAHPLSLPKLDQYLASVKPPPFSTKHVDTKGIMFPPLDRLEKTGLSLDDLVSNTKIPPIWRDRTSILWKATSFMVDLLVCLA